MKGKLFSFGVMLLLAFAGKVSAQGATIYGPNPVQPGSLEYYEVVFDYPPDPYTYIWWNVTGGTVTSESTNPTGTVYCWIQWDNSPGLGTIDIYENFFGMSGHRDISIGDPVYPGVIYTSFPYFNYQTSPAISQDPAWGGNCSASYNYTWEASPDNINWTAIGYGANYPSSAPALTNKTYIRRVVECNGAMAYSNVLEFNYRSVSWENRNYIRTNEIWYAGKTNFIQADNLPIGQKQQTTVYYDGLARPEQNVQMGAGTGVKDIVTPIEYDVLGRETKQHMPYAATTGDGKFKTGALTAQQAALANKYSGETDFFAETIYGENSPLNRATKKLSPGISWGGNDVGVTTSYELNDANDAVRIWNIDAFSASAVPVSNATDVYPANTLLKTVSINEDGKKSIEYRDKDDRVILKKQQSANSGSLGLGHSGWICTYYVYDDFGKLRFILPPQVVKACDDANNWVISQPVADGLCFRYLFDRKGRLIEKKEPDAEPVYLVYDNRDRVVFTQDGNQRAGKTTSAYQKEWIFFLYDVLNRPVATGSMIESEWFSRNDVQWSVDNLNGGERTLYIQTNVSEFLETYNPVPLFPGAGVILAYDQLKFNTVTYYDQSNASSYASVNLGYASNFENIEAPVPSKRNIGLITGKKARVLDASVNMFLTTTIIYDDKGRELQKTSSNYTGNAIRETNQYDFAGKVRSTLYTDFKVPSTGEYDNNTILSKYEFDHAGRQTKIIKNINRVYKYGTDPERILNSGDKVVLEDTYDDIGQSLTKTFAPGYAGPNGSYLEKLNYDYNVRGWLTGINKAYVSSSSQSGYFFGMELGYDKPGSAGFTVTALNGNVSGMAWKTAGNNIPRRYNYQYDNAGRLSGADYMQRSDFSSSNNWANNKMNFSVANLQYDVNSNLTRMEQQGVNFSGIVPMDKLTYNYHPNSNRLMLVNEDVPSSNYKLADFTDKNTGSTDYTYHESGNLKEDKNKGISEINYNLLGLPSLIVFDNNRGNIKYIYDADGNKLRKIVTDNTVTSNPPLVTTTTYGGLITYEGNIPTIIFENGRIRFSGKVNTTYPTAIAFDYFVKDHLNDVRMILTDDPEFLNPYPYATMENTTAGLENKYYNITNRTGKPVALQGNQTYDNRYGQQMSKLSSATGNNKIGPSILLKVMSGDVVHAESDYYYQSNGAQVNSGSLLSDLVTNLLSHLNAGNAGVTAKNEALTIQSNVQADNIVGSLITDQNNHYNTSPNNNKPKAYLNYILFDEQFQAVGKGFLQVQNNGPLQSPLVITDINVNKNGWIYVFTNNESQQDVYFDNFRVVHARGNLMEENHYYPFGLTMQAISSRALAINPVNKLKYNGKELQNVEFSDGSSLEHYDYGARFFDPQIGRWNSTDPLAKDYEAFSPYQYVRNNPALLIDPDGKGDEPINRSRYGGKIVIGPTTYGLNYYGSPNKNAYNCHSFAWWNSMGQPTDRMNPRGQPRWDENPLNNTGSYRQLKFSEPNKVGDRLMYFNVDASGKVVATHSAIVTKVDDRGNAVEVESKWGESHLYRHHPRDVPYGTDGYNPYDAPETFSHNGRTYESRVYFRYDEAKSLRDVNNDELWPRKDVLTNPLTRSPLLFDPWFAPWTGGMRYATQTFYIKPIR